MPTSIRLRDDLKQKLEKAKDGRTLTEEIELRLDQSFGYGEWATRALLLRIADGITELEKNHGTRWWKSRFTFDECLVFINEYLDDWRPSGKSSRPKKKGKDLVLLGRHVAEFERVRTIRGPNAIVLVPKITRARAKHISEMPVLKEHVESWVKALRRAREGK